VAKLSVGRESPFNDANVNHWLDEARDLGVIAFDIDPSFAINGRRIESATDTLGGAFELDEALVIDVGKPAQEDTKAVNLHVALSNQTGRRLTEVLGSRTNLLVAGGRTVIQIARKVSRKGPQWRSIRIDP